MKRIVVALAVAMAIASVGIGVTAKQEPNGVAPSADISAAAASALGTGKIAGWGVINGTTGVAARGERILSSTRLGVGNYEVRISKGNPPVPSNVTNCAFTANIGSVNLAGTEPTGEITTVGRVGDPAGIFITTHNSAGTLADRSFHIVVTC